MEKEQKAPDALARITAKLFGGLRMTWAVVVLYAVCTAALTAVFMIVPVFKGTSFQRMGETFEAWIFFAVILMANCEKPLESAVKTFVFFLVSQPLIYLFQVPFSWMGWGLFRFYRYWFIWTLLTLPMAYAGWYLRRRNWLSLLILLPVQLFLACTSVVSFRSAFAHFPHYLLTAVFCLLQVLLYGYVFASDFRRKLLGILLPFGIAAVLMAVQPRMELDATLFFPDDSVLTEAAVVVMEESDSVEVSIAGTGEDSRLRVHALAYGTWEFSVRDGDAEYRYTLEVYEDDGGHSQVRLTPR